MFIIYTCVLFLPNAHSKNVVRKKGNCFVQWSGIKKEALVENKKTRKQENKSCSLDRHKNHVPKKHVDPMLGLFADICGKPRFLTSAGIV